MTSWHHFQVQMQNNKLSENSLKINTFHSSFWIWTWKWCHDVTETLFFHIANFYLFTIYNDFIIVTSSITWPGHLEFSNRRERFIYVHKLKGRRENQEHGTFRNMPEHAGTFRNMKTEIKIIFMKKNNKNKIIEIK